MSLSEYHEFEGQDYDDTMSARCVDGAANPNWHGRLAWDLGVIMLVVADALVLPFQMAYKEDGDFVDEVWQWITTSFFFLDMVLSFFTGYIAGPKEQDKGKLVTSKRRIAKNYLRTWFVIDFASTIPWGTLADVLSGGNSSGRSAQMAKLTKVVKFVRFLRLMRMLRLAKLAMIWEKIEASLGSVILRQSVALLRVLFVLIGVCHWNACIWWMVGDPESLFTDLLSDEAKAHYMRQAHWTTTRRGEAPDYWTWKSRDTSDQYIFCFYWTLGVMRTMPAEVQPENKVERLYIMVFMFFAFSVFAICISLITQTFFKFNERKRMFDDDMAAVRVFMRGIKAPDNLQTSVKTFLQHMYDKRKTHAKELPMLNNLPPSLFQKLKYERFRVFLDNLPMVAHLPPRALHHICELAEIRDVAPGYSICKKQRVAEACFILMHGHFSIRDPVVERGESIEIVDEDCLTHDNFYSDRTVIADMCSEVLRLDRSKFRALLRSHPAWQSSFTRTMTFANSAGYVNEEAVDYGTLEERMSDMQAYTNPAPLLVS